MPRYTYSFVVAPFKKKSSDIKFCFWASGTPRTSGTDRARYGHHRAYGPGSLTGALRTPHGRRKTPQRTPQRTYGLRGVICLGFVFRVGLRNGRGALMGRTGVTPPSVPNSVCRVCKEPGAKILRLPIYRAKFEKPDSARESYIHRTTGHVTGSVWAPYG